MKILAFLQNQWFKDPEGVRRIFQKWPDKRNYLIRSYLFMGCLTGKRLQAAFGEDLCDEIIWEEASSEVGSVSRSKFAADRQHMLSAIKKHQPEVILCFGAIAKEGLDSLETLFDVLIIYGPHPAARNDPMPRLREMAQELTQ